MTVWLLVVYFHCNGILIIEGEKFNFRNEILKVFSKERLDGNVPQEQRGQMEKDLKKSNTYKTMFETSGEIMNANDHGFGLKYNPTLLNSVKNLEDKNEYNSNGFIPKFSTKINEQTHTATEISLEDLMKLKENTQNRIERAENGTEMNML